MGYQKSTRNKAGEPDLGVFFLVILTPLSSGAANTSKLVVVAFPFLTTVPPVSVLIHFIIEVLGSRAPNGAPKSTQNKAGEPDLGVFF